MAFADGQESRVQDYRESVSTGRFGLTALQYSGTKATKMGRGTFPELKGTENSTASHFDC